MTAKVMQVNPWPCSGGFHVACLVGVANDRRSRSFTVLLRCGRNFKRRRIAILHLPAKLKAPTGFLVAKEASDSLSINEPEITVTRTKTNKQTNNKKQTNKRTKNKNLKPKELKNYNVKRWFDWSGEYLSEMTNTLIQAKKHGSLPLISLSYRVVG